MAKSKAQSALPPVPPPSSQAARAVMRGNRSVETKPERALRSALHRRGLRFRKNARPDRSLACRADIVFHGARIAVFVDGCFWHRCPIHGIRPVTNRSYWDAKIDRNVNRDRRNDATLTSAGWVVIRIWEHEPVEAAASRVELAVRSSTRRASGKDQPSAAAIRVPPRAPEAVQGTVRETRD